jgi:hypothetical protein
MTDVRRGDEMFGIKIRDRISTKSGGRALCVDLRDILAAVGEAALTSRWRCRDLWYTIRDGGKMDEVRESRRQLTGEEMQRFAATVLQTIDGRFEARSGGAAKHPWLVILAVDSSWFEVWSSKRAVLESVRTHFREVSDLPATTA